MTQSASEGGKNRLNEAVRRNRILSREGMLEVLFAWLFRGLVYPQIWEDPEIDMERWPSPDCHCGDRLGAVISSLSGRQPGADYRC